MTLTAIRKRMIKMDLNGTELAEILAQNGTRVSRQYVWALAEGKRRPSKRLALVIAHVLGIKAEVLRRQSNV